jgi:hypothetical protein
MRFDYQGRTSYKPSISAIQEAGGTTNREIAEPEALNE